ncbi:unnamed protein product [Brachionus calyciflorus]|uniref:Uncharacterized protein n=1 Tax=Brachionus calyciflorus TaxID=104777 RepID=A0A814M0D8_9BILA|nr:unnamed protein product [Brachionus calyciflorus]
MKKVKLDYFSNKLLNLIYTYDLFRKDESNQAFFKIYNTFIKYFEATYIGELKRGKGGGRKDPRFKHEIWNVYTRNIEGLPRTNNNIEGWHNALQRVIKRSPSIYTFIDGIKLEENNTETIYLQLATGIVPKRRPVYMEIDMRISEIVSDFSKEKCLEYLKNIALIIDY